MKKSFIMIPAMLLAMLFSSCLEHKVTLTVNQDGSGTLEEKTIFGASMLAMMAQAPAEAGDPVAETIDRMAKAATTNAQKMGEGVTVLKAGALEGDQKGVSVVYAFKDVNQLKYSFGSGMASMSPDGGDQSKDDPIDISYENNLLTIKSPKPKGEDLPDEEPTDQDIAMAQQIMGDMKVSMDVVLPGGIEETNAKHVQDNTVTMMHMDMNKVLADPAKFKEMVKAEPKTR